MKKIQKLFNGIFFIGIVLLTSCNDPNDCDGCKGVVIATFEDKEAKLYYNRDLKTSNLRISKYEIELVNPSDYYGARAYLCDTILVSKLPKKAGGTPIIISGNGKAICGGNGINVWGYVYIESVRLK